MKSETGRLIADKWRQGLVACPDLNKAYRDGMKLSVRKGGDLQAEVKDLQDQIDEIKRDQKEMELFLQRINKAFRLIHSIISKPITKDNIYE